MAGESNSDVVITVESSHDTWRRNEARRTEVRNDTSTFSEWLFEEAVWFVAQFLKVALSVAAFRGIHQLFRSKLANESAYRRAPDLWTHGHQEPTGGGGDRARAEGSRTAAGPFNAWPGTYSSSANGAAADAAPDRPRYICTVEGRHFYAHGRRLHPEHHWPCPLLVQTPCRTCSFLEYDSAGAPQCVAVWKMKSALNGIDGGESLDDVRDWINNS